MNIIIGIAIEAITALASVTIKFNTKYDCLVSIANKGYKYKKDILDEYLEKQKMKELEPSKINIFKNRLSFVLTFIPFINLIEAESHKIYTKYKMKNNPIFKSSLIPMSEKELEEFKKIDSRVQKLMYTGAINKEYKNKPKKEEKQEQKQEIVEAEKPEEVKKMYIRHSELLPLDYTLDEVQRLNKALTIQIEGPAPKLEYKIGRIGSYNIAIIGVPDSNNENKSKHLEVLGEIMEEIPEEEVKQRTFSVYPYIIFSDNEFELLKQTVEEIRQEREYNEEFIEKNDNSITPDSNGPVLKKTITKNRVNQ